MNRTKDRTGSYWQRDQLALRMMRHGAHNSTVSAWTGLSVNHIKTLVQRSADVPQLCHRERPTLAVTYFFRTPKVTTHAGALGSLFELFEVLSHAAVDTPAQSLRTLSRGEKLCSAYEMYGAIVKSVLIGFEQAVLLATALAEGKEISLRPCPQCEAAMLVDCLVPATDACTHCRSSALLPVIPGNPAESIEEIGVERIRLHLVTRLSEDF